MLLQWTRKSAFTEVWDIQLTLNAQKRVASIKPALLAWNTLPSWMTWFYWGCLERAKARSTVVRANARSATRTHTHWFITVQTNVDFICYRTWQTIKQACDVWVNEVDVGLCHVPEQNSTQLVHNAARATKMKEDAFKGVFPMHTGALILSL